MTTLPPPSLSRILARKIIEQVGSSGQPPEEGLHHFSVGLESYLRVIDAEYLNDYIREGGAAFKMVVGLYGGGKTHFLYSVRDQAWNHGYAITYVSLKSSGECPFHALELVYKAIVGGIVPTLPAEERERGYDRGIGVLLRAWYGQRYQSYVEEGMSTDMTRERLRDDIESLDIGPSISFRNAIRSALLALHNQREEAFNTVCQWLLGEGFDRRLHTPYGIQQKIDRTTAMPMIRSLGRTMRALGYTGLVILLDEAERIPSLSTRNKEQHLSNLRELIDECSHSLFAGIMVFYAVPDENFLEGRTQVYEALVQRLSTVFDTPNPTGVKILLERTITDHVAFLCQIGYRLASIYSTAYQVVFPENALDQLIPAIAAWAERVRFGDEGYKRLFVQTLIRGLEILHRQNRIPTVEELH